jgi:hypothetical protein
LARHQNGLARRIEAHPVAAPLLYQLAYVLAAALSLPQAVILAVAGGLLFGTLFGGILTVIGATVGAPILAAGRAPDLLVLFGPRILLPLIGLAALSLLPVLLRRYTGGNAEST